MDEGDAKHSGHIRPLSEIVIRIDIVYWTIFFLGQFLDVLVIAIRFVSSRSTGWTDSQLRTSILDPNMHVFLVKLQVPRPVNATSVPPPYE